MWKGIALAEEPARKVASSGRDLPGQCWNHISAMGSINGPHLLPFSTESVNVPILFPYFLGLER